MVEKRITFAHEESLPSLPVPKLQATCEKYLRSLMPLLTTEEYARSEAAVLKFLSDGTGDKLHGLLLEHASTTRNWLEAFWDDAAYLEARYPNAVNTNWMAGFLGVAERLPGGADAVSAAAAGAFALAKFYDACIRKAAVQPEVVRRQPISMFQNLRVFGANQVPGRLRDTLTFASDGSQRDPKHVAVLSLDRWYGAKCLTNSAHMAGCSAHCQAATAPLPTAGIASTSLTPTAASSAPTTSPRSCTPSPRPASAPRGRASPCRR